MPFTISLSRYDLDVGIGEQRGIVGANLVGAVNREKANMYCGRLMA